MFRIVVSILLFFLNCYFLYKYEDKLYRKSIFNLINFSFFPQWLGNIIGLIFIILFPILCCFSYSFILTFGFYLYDYIVYRDLKNILLTIVGILFSDIFVSNIFDKKNNTNLYFEGSFIMGYDYIELQNPL